MRFLFPSAFVGCAARCRARRPASDCPTSTLDRPLVCCTIARRPSPEVSVIQPTVRGAVDRSSSLWFSRDLRFAPCVFGRVQHAPQTSRFTPVRPGHASRSLFGATFRYPCFVEPFHNRAAHPHFASRARMVRQRSWDFRTLRSVPRLRVPAFVMGRALSFVRVHLRRSSPPAVIECTSRRLFLQLSVARIDLSLLNKLLPHTSE